MVLPCAAVLLRMGCPIGAVPLLHFTNLTAMATLVPTETNPAEAAPAALIFPLTSPQKKRSNPGSAPASNALFVNATQHRAVRFVSFMLEDGKYEITPAEFLAEALARHFTFYQSKRGIEFPPKMLAELTAVGALSGKSASEE